MKWLTAILLALLAGFGLTAYAATQPPLANLLSKPSTADASKPGDNGIPEDFQARRREITEQLRVAQRTADATSNKQASSKPDGNAATREVELLKQLEVVVAQRQSVASQQYDLETQLSDLQAQIDSVSNSGPVEEPPYSFLMLDQLNDQLKSLQRRDATVEATMGNVEQAVLRAKNGLEAKTQQVLQAKSQSGQENRTQSTQPAATVKLAEIEAKIANETLLLRKHEQTNENLNQKIHRAKSDVLTRKIAWIQRSVNFSKDDLQTQLLELDKHEADLRRELRFAESEQAQSEREWVRARTQLDDSKTRERQLVELVQAKQIIRQGLQQQVTILNVRLQRVGIERELWNRRYHVIRKTADAENLIEWTDETRNTIDQLTRDKALAQLRTDEIREDIATLEKKLLASTEAEEQLNRRIVEQRDGVSAMLKVNASNIASIEATLSLANKVLGEIEGDVSEWSWSEWIESVKYYFGKIRNTVITTVDDHPISIGTVIVGLFLVFCGFILARMTSRWIGRRLRGGRIAMHESGASALQTLSFYVLLVCFTLTALRFVNLPLTVFTFFGGAIAIGVGFGSQNIINNFISGLILLAERPIRVGDLVRIESEFGNVETIGARSTRIRTGQNLDVIIPNSKFLENDVINLTLGDDRLRTQVNIGVAYGSPTREVAKLLKKAAEEHGNVLKTPEPFVLFADFGDNSLNFELHFWLSLRTLTDRRRVESDLRFRIDNLFRDAKISIAFPQRDIHIDTSVPLPIRMLPTQDSTGKPDVNKNSSMH